MINSISISEFLRLINSSSINIIDVRGIESYNNGHISGAHNIPFNQLIIEPTKYLSKNQSYYLYCQKGSKSKKACQILSKMGYKVINISGGYEAWVLSK